MCKHCDILPGTATARTEQQRLPAFLDIAANGISRISKSFPGMTDTSSNLGVLALEQGAFNATLKVRALRAIRIWT